MNFLIYLNDQQEQQKINPEEYQHIWIVIVLVRVQKMGQIGVGSKNFCPIESAKCIYIILYFINEQFEKNSYPDNNHQKLNAFFFL